MHITDSQLMLGSTHALEESSVRVRVISRERIHEPGKDLDFGELMKQELNKLQPARENKGGNDNDPQAPCLSTADQIHDMVQTLLNMLFGPTVAASPDNQAFPAGKDAPATLEQGKSQVGPPRPLSLWKITEIEQTKETESCQFAASGKVCLADGSERQFDVGFNLERSEETTRITQRTMTDPLVIDSTAPRAVLADTSVVFDLNNDGKQERMRLPGAGSALLFLDRNHNGRADNGSELFGPNSGNGFTELARLDSDHNGWIDSADQAFVDLKLWQSGEGKDQQIRSLNEAGIGALATTAANTPFELKMNGEQVGQMRSSSVWLGETGGAGVVRQVDVSTTPVIEKPA